MCQNARKVRKTIKEIGKKIDPGPVGGEMDQLEVYRFLGDGDVQSYLYVKPNCV